MLKMTNQPKLYQLKTNNVFPDVINQTIEGTSNYEELENKPKINNVELIGNKTTEDLGIKSYDDTQIKKEIEDLKELVSKLPNWYYYEYINSYGMTDKKQETLTMFNEIKEKLENQENVYMIIRKMGVGKGRDLIFLCSPTFGTFNDDYIRVISSYSSITSSNNVKEFNSVNLIASLDNTTQKITQVSEKYNDGKLFLTTTYSMKDYTMNGMTNNFVLSTTNDKSYTPAGDYNPATKNMLMTQLQH